MSESVDQAALRQERVRLQAALASLNDLRPTMPGNRLDSGTLNPERPGLAPQEPASPAEPAPVPFVRQLDFSDMVWDDVEAPPTPAAAAPPGASRENVDHFAAQFAWHDPAESTEPPALLPHATPAKENKPTAETAPPPETLDNAFTHFDWE